MPKIINAYAEEDSLTKMLSTLGQSFGANTPATEYARQKAQGAARENANVPLLADAIAKGDVATIARLGVLAGVDPAKYSGGHRFVTANTLPVDDPRVSQSMLGAGDAFSTTPIGVTRGFENARTLNDMTTARTQASERYKVDNTPELVQGPNGPMIARRSEAFGQTPVLNQGQAQGTILQQDMPNLSPEQRAQAGGYAPKAPGNIWAYRRPDGGLGNSIDGRTDSQTGQPVTGGLMKLEGPSADGLSGNEVIDRQVLASRVAVGTAVKSIDNTIAELQKPDAGAAIGVLGRGARLFNDLRAQADAAVRVFGGQGSDVELGSPDVQNAAGMVTEKLFGNPNLNARAQQLGIDSAVLRSRIMDLAYTIAKAQDPGGRISRDDIERAGEVVGMSLMDPQSATQVLSNLKTSLIESQNIRETETRRQYPTLRAWGGAPTAPNAPAPQAGAAPAAVEEWQRDPATGKPVRVR